jgi:hypothetical protein
MASACGVTVSDLAPRNWMPPPGFLGRQINPRPEPAPVTETGGMHGVLVGGGDLSPVPTELADAAVADELRRWLSPGARQALAEASQIAATGERNGRVAWAEKKPGGAESQSGWAMPISDPYRASHGALCRDVRQALTRDEDALVQLVSLCREEVAVGGYIWTRPHWP